MDDAEERFFDAVRAFQGAEKAARADMTHVDEKAFRRAIIDLDAGITGLDGLQLGRAKLLKASALWWIDWSRLGQRSLLEAGKVSPELTEAHELAVAGLSLLKRSGASDSELSWANDLVEKTQR